MVVECNRDCLGMLGAIVLKEECEGGVLLF